MWWKESGKAILLSAWCSALTPFLIFPGWCMNRCLEKKALSQSTDDYRDLDYIDEAGNEYIERKE